MGRLRATGGGFIVLRDQMCHLTGLPNHRIVNVFQRNNIRFRSPFQADAVPPIHHLI